MKKNHIAYFAALGLIFLSVVVNGLTSDEEKCLESYSVWKESLGKCSKECKACPYGTGRNFTNIEKLVRRSNGDLRCPPCEECQTGYFSDNSVTCRRCVVDCRSTFNRHVQQECTKVNDFSCGSCLPGFTDEYKSIDFPCMLDKNNTRMVPTNQPRDEQNLFQNTTARSMELVDRQDGKHLLLLFLIVPMVLITIISTVIIGLIPMREWRIPCRKDHLLKYCRYERVKHGASLDDIEMDGGDTGTKIANYSRQNSNDVRQHTLIDRGTEAQENVRAERQAVSSNGQEQRVSAANLCYHWEDFQKMGQFCKCLLIPQCSCCNVLRNRVSVLITRSDPILRQVATNICHDPNPLFQTLGIPPSKVYQMNNTRDRDPDTFTEAEMVLRLLHTWVERKPDYATLKTLCESLCQTGFHSIVNDIIKKLGL